MACFYEFGTYINFEVTARILTHTYIPINKWFALFIYVYVLYSIVPIWNNGHSQLPGQTHTQTLLLYIKIVHKYFISSRKDTDMFEPQWVHAFPYVCVCVCLWVRVTSACWRNHSYVRPIAKWMNVYVHKWMNEWMPECSHTCMLASML